MLAFGAARERAENKAARDFALLAAWLQSSKRDASTEVAWHMKLFLPYEPDKDADNDGVVSAEEFRAARVEELKLA